MSRHTAGPWSVHDFYHDDIVGRNGKMVAGCYGGYIDTDLQQPDFDSECHYNAILIAKAPQLLEFSQQVIEAFFEEYEHDESAPENSITVIAIRRLQAVIREAKGLSENDRTKGTNLTDTHKPQPQPTKPSPRPTPDDANPPGQPGGK